MFWLRNKKNNFQIHLSGCLGNALQASSLRSLNETVLLRTHNMFWLRNKKTNFQIHLSGCLGNALQASSLRSLNETVLLSTHNIWFFLFVCLVLNDASTLMGH